MHYSPLAFKELCADIRREKLALVLLSFFVNILLLVTAIYMLQVYDKVLTSSSLDTLFWLTVIALFAIAIYGVLDQARRLILGRIAGFIDGKLNAPVLEQAMAENLADQPVTATVKDVSDFRTYYQSDAALAFLDAPWSIVFLIFIWGLHPMLGVIGTVGAAVLVGAALLNDLMTRRQQNAAAADIRSTNEEAVQYSQSGETLSALGMVGALLGRWQLRQEKARAIQQKLGERTTTILSFTRPFRMGLQVMILGTGAYYVLAGQLTPGAMIAGSIILGRALAPIERATAAWSRRSASRAAFQKLKRLFTRLENTPKPLQLPKPKGNIALENLTYAAPGSKVRIIDGISCDLKPGSICAILGESGAGKTTLCRLLVGVWKPSSGCARLDGASIHSWNQEDLGVHIGYLPQHVEMYDGTVGQNIARFSDNPDSDVIAAAKLAGVHELILHLPAGYETQAGAKNNQISLGQRQRIGLARAVFGNPSFIVLDEPNSNLDKAGDLALLIALVRLKEMQSTVVVVSHRASVLRVADKVALMHYGRFAKFGDAADVIKPAEAQRVQATGQVSFSAKAQVT